MRYCLGDSRSGQQLGAVSCLHLSPDGSRSGAARAAGQATGQQCGFWGGGGGGEREAVIDMLLKGALR